MTRTMLIAGHAAFVEAEIRAASAQGQSVGALSITGPTSVRGQALPIVPARVELAPQPRNRADRRRLAHAKR